MQISSKLLSRASFLSTFRTTIARKNSSISALQAAFRDPESPFYQAPGTQGPESPDSPTPDSLPKSSTSQLPKSQSLSDDRQAAQEVLESKGFDPVSFSEQTIAWGDQDPFQHVNNAEYFRYFESASSARIKWMMAFGQEIGGPSKARAMLNGQGVSLILKSFEINFRRPVTFPDTLFIGYKVLPLNDRDLSTFHVTASAYSIEQKAFVAHTKEAIVWYDYERLKKCIPDDKTIEYLRRRIASTG